MSATLSIPGGGQANITQGTPVNVLCTFGGQTIPVDEFVIVGGAYGSIGRSRFHTSMSMLQALKIDLYNLAVSSGPSVEVQVKISYGNTTPVRIFGGEYLNTSWDYDQDEVIINARDYLGVLMDQHRLPRSLTQDLIKFENVGQSANSLGIGITNQTLSNVVTAIANEWGLTPILGLQANPVVGTQYGTLDKVFSTVPQSLWQILTNLAIDTGYEVFGTPYKQLYFGQPGEGQQPLGVSYKAPFQQLVTNNQGIVPCHSVSIEHEPRRNATFTVLVISQDFAKAQPTKGYATVVAPGVQGFTPGIQTGAQAVSTNSAMRSAKLQVPLYTFHAEGLTADQAQTKAAAIALDIAKRAVVVSFTIDGYIDVLPTKPVKLYGMFDESFKGLDYYVTAFQHSFRMPRDTNARGSRHSGFVTHIKAWNLSQEALAKGGVGG